MRYPMEAPGRGCGGLGSHRTAPDQQRAIGSAGERLVHTEEVTGSIPVSPTTFDQLKGPLKGLTRSSGEAFGVTGVTRPGAVVPRSFRSAPTQPPAAVLLPMTVLLA